jgi:hypothetical protein
MRGETWKGTESRGYLGKRLCENVPLLSASRRHADQDSPSSTARARDVRAFRFVLLGPRAARLCATQQAGYRFAATAAAGDKKRTRTGAVRG